MKRLIPLAIVVLIAWQAYSQYQRRHPTQEAVVTPALKPPASLQEIAPSSSFRCDGRTYCSQMTSCAEATFFLKNCHGVKMDGDNDGVPCEQQWCK